jgi:uncharacterized protein YbjT (DUF2867 family)
MKQANIFLTGATGSVGIELIRHLEPLNVQIKALVRSDSQAASLNSLPYVQSIKGDLADPASFQPALEGIETAFLLTNSSQQAESLQINFVEAAHRAGVRHIVKLSQFAASESSPVRFLRYHAKVENKIKELGFTYTFLRPNLYMQGLLSFKDYIREKGHFFAAIGAGKVSAIDVRDIAAVAAACLTQPGHENKTYDLTGPEPLSHHEMAGIFSRVLNKPVQFIDVAPAQMQAGLLAAGFGNWQADGLIEDYAHYARQEAAEVYNTVQAVTGKSAICFEQFARDYAGLFGA